MSLARLRAVAATLLLAGLAVVAVAPSASAHAELEGSEPADGAKLAEVPASVVLTFGEEIEPTLVRARVEWPAGAGADVTAATDGEVVTIPVSSVPEVAALDAAGRAGDWKVVYRVVSQDGHPISGTIAFSVPQPVAVETTPTATPTATPTPSAPAVTAEPTATPGATISPVPAGALDDPDGDGSGTPWFGILAGLLLAAVAVTYGLWLRRLRRRPS